jgi:hypothetical protein
VDQSIAYGVKMSKLIDEVAKSDAQKEDRNEALSQE